MWSDQTESEINEIVNIALVLSRYDEEYDIYEDNDYDIDHIDPSKEFISMLQVFNDVVVSNSERNGYDSKVSVTDDLSVQSETSNQITSNELNESSLVDSDQTESIGANDMHIAVYNCDINRVLELLSIRSVQCWDTVDHRGNSPLLLAIKLRFVELAKLLIAEGFSCDRVSRWHGAEYHLMDDAVLTRDVSLVKAAYSSLQKDSWKKWVEKRPLLLEQLEQIPDMYIEMSWKFSGTGPMSPVVKMFAPHDTYKIWKKGSWLRLDSTIAGFSRNLSARRCDLSLIFRGSGGSESHGVRSDCDGDLFLINRSEGTYLRVLRRIERPSDTETSNFAHRMITSQSSKVNSVDVDATNWSFRPIVDRSGKTKSCVINGETCLKWEARGDMKIKVHSKSNNNDVLCMSEHEYFHEEDGVAEHSIESSTRLRRKEREKTVDKHVRAGVYMTPNFPISITELMPIMEIFSMRNEYVEKLANIFGGASNYSIPSDLFPYRLQVPIFLGVSAVVTFSRVERHPDVETTMFDIPVHFNEIVDDVDTT